MRPLQSILCLLSDEAGAEVVPFEIEGIVAADQTFGHRFMAPDPITVSGFDAYQSQLKRAYVMVDAAERRAMIWNEATIQAFALGVGGDRGSGVVDRSGRAGGMARGN